MEIEFRLPGPDDPFAPPKPRPEDLGPDDLGNRGVLRAGLEEQGKQLTAEFAELDAARRKAEEEIELERAGVDLTLEGARLAGLPDDEGARESDPLKAFADFAKQRIAALPEGARDDAALHAGQERLRLDRTWRKRRHNTRVQRLQAGVDQSLDALTAEAGREPGRLAELAERGFGVLQATGEGLRFDEDQNKTVRGRFGTQLAEAALRAMAPKQALAALDSGAVAALLPDDETRETLRSELTAAAANERRALKAETAGLRTLHLAQLDRGEPGVSEIARDVEIDFGADEARAFNEQAEAARQRHRLRRQWRLAPESEIAAGLERAEASGNPGPAQAVASELRAQRRRDPAAVVAEDPKLQGLLAAAEDDPAQRELATSVSLELQKELGIQEKARRVLTRQGLADLTAQIEAAPPGQRAALLQQVRGSYGAHYDRVLSELDGARLDPTTLALAKRLDDPVAARRLTAMQGKTRASLTEGLDPAEAAAVADAARAAVPGPLAPVSERMALARYQQTGDLGDAVDVARETLGGEGTDSLMGGSGNDQVRTPGEIVFGPEDVEPAFEDETVFVPNPIDPESPEQPVSHEQIDDLQARADDLAASEDGIPPELAEEIGLLVLGVLPGTGEVLSAKEAYDAFRAAEAALRDDDIAEALLKGAEGSVAAIGAIPVIGGTVRLGRAALRLAETLRKLLRRVLRTPASLPSTPSMTKKQKKRFGDLSEADRLVDIRPRNTFAGPDAFQVMSPNQAFRATKWPPRSPEENAFRGLASVDRLTSQVLKSGRGIIRNAMRRDDLPPGQQAITFRWGVPGDGPTFKDGNGFSHIIAKHGPEVVEDIVETIALGAAPRVKTVLGKLRAEIRHNDFVVFLALDHDGARETWVLSGFKDVRGANRHFNLRELVGPMFFKGEK